MSPRKIGPHLVYPIGLGCMSLSHAYGAPPPVEQAGRLLNTALDLGYTFLDTAALYGFGANEALIGDALGSRRGEYVLASKCGMFRGDDGKREINGRPEVLRRTCEDSLRRLKTELIDLYYLHRWDRRVPIEESVGELSRLVEEGKIAAIGLSEVSAATLKKAHATYPIAALQTEYSLWTRNAEVAVLEACKEIGAAFVAFSPVGRGFLADGVVDADQLAANDIRRQMPRFQGEAFAANLALLKGLREIARELNATPAQVSLAWLLTRGEHVIPIPGTTQIAHLEANFEAARLELSADVLGRLDDLINPRTVRGPRYNAATQAEIDTEELAA
jgi:aryl-alcohol dehydrogenase-like predicted oxidoreductase